MAKNNLRRTVMLCYKS